VAGDSHNVNPNITGGGGADPVIGVSGESDDLDFSDSSFSADNSYRVGSVFLKLSPGMIVADARLGITSLEIEFRFFRDELSFPVENLDILD